MELQEMIAVLQAFEEGKDIEAFDDNRWIVVINPLFTAFNFDKYEYRIKPQPTREEITSAWVKDNNIVVGSKVIVTGSVFSGVEVPSLYAGVVYSVYQTTIGVDLGNIRNLYEIESLEPYKEVWSPFSWADRDLFRGKWVRSKNRESTEFMVDNISEECAFGSFLYKEAFEYFEFIDGTPFGKLKP